MLFVPAFVPGQQLARAFYDVGLFHERPFLVLGSARFVDACLERVTDPWLRALPLVGAIDQFVDSTDVTSKPEVFPHVASLFEAWVDDAASGS